MQQARLVDRQFGVDHQAQVRQVQATGRHVCGDAGPRVAVTQRLQGVGALLLGHLARERDGREAALTQGAVQVPHALARVAEHQGSGAFEVAQEIDHRVLDLIRRHADGAVLDVTVRLVAPKGVDPQAVALIAPGQHRDVLGDRRREQQRPPFGRCRIENLLQILAESEVEHLVGLVEDDHLQTREVQRTALNVVAQAAGRADHHVAARLQGAALA